MIADAVERIPSHTAMLERLRDERSEAAKHLAAILRTTELLESARVSLITRYRDVVEKSFIRYVGELSSSVGTSFADDARSFTVSGEFDVSIAEGGVTRSPILYSTGYRDLFALCLRFALTDALFSEEPVPMILDDPFVNLDDAKLGEAIRLLERLSGDRQILYFTCSSVRAPGISSEKSP
jgi:DNA repair exonuclease SbcCD ATPase subunit